MKEVASHVISGLEIKTEGIVKSVQKAIDIARKDVDAVYVSVCSEVLDVSFNPAGPPDMCGLTSFE